MKYCMGVRWVDDNVYVSGSDINRKGRIHILDSNGKHISSVSSIGSIGSVKYFHHKDNIYIIQTLTQYTV